MVEQATPLPDQPVNTGEEIVNTPFASIGLDADAQFRTLSVRLEEVASKIGTIAEPKRFQLGDVINLAAIVFGILVALLTGYGLSERIGEVEKNQADAEARLTNQNTAMEGRLSGRMEKLDDRFTQLDERTATIEGARGIKSQH